MKTSSIVLLGIAGALIAYVMHQESIVHFNKKFAGALLPNLAIALLMAAVLYRYAGTDGVVRGAIAGTRFTLGFIPLLLIVFWAVGEGEVFINMHRDFVEQMLQGKHGIPGAFAAAVLMPSSMTGLPIVEQLWANGNKPVLMTFLLVSPMLGIMPVIMWRKPLLGWDITGWYIACATGLSLLAASGAWAFRAIRF